MSDLTDISAALLVGGLGTRLRPVLPDRPKALATADGKPFLNRLLDQVAQAGIRHVVLCSGHLGSAIEATYGPRYGTLALEYSREPAPLDTAGALRLALPRYHSDTILAMNGDSYCDVDLVAFWKSHGQVSAPASLVTVEVDDTSRSGRVAVDDENQVLRFEEKGAHHGPGLISSGIYLLGPEFLSSIPKDRAVSIEREMFPMWIGRGLRAFRHRGRFFDIGTPAAYATVDRFFSDTT